MACRPKLDTHTSQSRARSARLVVSGFALLLAGSHPIEAGRRVIEDGELRIPLQGYPEQPPPPARPPAPSGTPLQRAMQEARAPEARATVFGGTTGNMAQAVGRLGVTIAPWSEIYRQRDPRSTILNRLPSGQYFAVKGEQAGYYAVLMVDGSIGWIPVTSVQLLNYDVVAETGPPRRAPSMPGTGGMADLAGLPAAVIREAYRYLGVRYSWGGNGFRGIDCSGLVRNVFARCGLYLPRTASQQSRHGTRVDMSDLRPGDRLYFRVKRRTIDHTGIYLGNGLFIHASMSRGEVGVDRLSKPLYANSLTDVRRF